MTNRSKFVWIWVVIGVSVAGCAQKKTAVSDSGTLDAMATESGVMDSDHDNARGLRSNHFDFKSSELSSEERKIVLENVRLLKQNPTWLVELEGHGDQRGGDASNFQIGERRAQSVQRLVVELGIKSQRVSRVSYGKTRPIDPGLTESAMSRNRRVNWLLLIQ